MNLYARATADVQRVLALHRTHFGIVRGCLDDAVQEAGGYWEPPNPDFRMIDPCTRSGHIRAMAGAQVQIARGTMYIPHGEDYLDQKMVPFSGLHFYTKDGQRIRTRLRPRNTRTGQPLRPSKRGTLVLFGHDPILSPYEISILLDIDLRTKTLNAAYLAAIDWGEDDKGREIYYEVEIPANAAGGFGNTRPTGQPLQPGPGTPPEDDFADLLGEDEQSVGLDQA